jgi:hypothetical protein
VVPGDAEVDEAVLLVGEAQKRAGV